MRTRESLEEELLALRDMTREYGSRLPQLEKENAQLREENEKLRAAVVRHAMGGER